MRDSVLRLIIQLIPQAMTLIERAIDGDQEAYDRVEKLLPQTGRMELQRLQAERFAQKQWRDDEETR